MSFNEEMFAYYSVEEKFTDALCEAGFGEFNRIGGDRYDNSIEFYKVSNDVRLNAAAQKIIFEAGFSRCWTNHDDGSEWYYSWQSKEFTYTSGSQHKKPNQQNIKE